MIARLAPNSTDAPFSRYRHNQGLDQLEGASEALFGHGVVSGGVVVVVSALQVKVPSGTVFLVQGVAYTLPADVTINLPASTTGGTLYGKLTRTAGTITDRTSLDTYGLSLSVSAPAAPYNALAIFTTGVSSVTSLTEPTSGKYALPQLHPRIRSVTATGTVTVDDEAIFADATAGAIVLTLPAASAGFRPVRVMKTDSSGNTVTVQRAGSDTINGATTNVLSTQYAAKTYIPNGAAFWGAW